VCVFLISDDILTVRNESRKATLVQACYISMAAIMGVLFRMILAQFFGEECANPGTVGWLAASSPLCVTADGSATQSGGIVFADLPSNIIGSFFMGMFQDGVVLHLAVPLTIAWVGPFHSFQTMTVLHTAFKTGFCGSLTTFSSWNAEMVVMLFHTDTTRTSQVFSALLGYIIGMETALGSFVCGKSVARRLHRMVNPILAAEADASRARREEGVYIDKELPDFERRFLANLDIKGGTYGELLPLGRLDALERWRASTATARRVGHAMLPILIEIEQAVFVAERPVPSELASIALGERWDVDSLQEWTYGKARDIEYLPSLGSRSMSSISMPTHSVWFTLPVASLLLTGFLMVLIVLLLMLDGGSIHTVTYRTMVYAMLFAPAGALLRWKLSSLNGKLNVEGWEWLPLGTLLVNVLGSAMSTSLVASEYRIGSNYFTSPFWTVGTIRAAKIGFAGSLTTVSTFIAEVSGFMQQKTEHAYPYIMTTLILSCGLSAVVYGSIVQLT
jgi:CrcB protein